MCFNKSYNKCTHQYGYTEGGLHNYTHVSYRGFSWRSELLYTYREFSSQWSEWLHTCYRGFSWRFELLYTYKGFSWQGSAWLYMLYRIQLTDLHDYTHVIQDSADRDINDYTEEFYNNVIYSTYTVWQGCETVNNYTYRDTEQKYFFTYLYLWHDEYNIVFIK